MVASSLNTPCVAGCCGPTLSTICCVSRPRSATSAASSSGQRIGSSTLAIASFPLTASGSGLVGVLGPRPLLDLSAAGELEGLEPGVALEVLGEVQVAQVWVTLEFDAEHLVALTLVPFGSTEHAGERGAHGIRDVYGNVHGGVDGVLGRVHVHQHFEPSRLVVLADLQLGSVDGRQEGEEA